MDKNFDSVKVVVDNVNVEWSREIAEIFKSLYTTAPPSNDFYNNWA